MSSESTTRPREIEAKAAVQAAANGDLPYVNDYTLQYSASQFRVGVDPFFTNNTSFGKGSVAGLYVDIERGMLVYDFQQGDEYNPTKEGKYGNE